MPRMKLDIISHPPQNPQPHLQSLNGNLSQPYTKSIEKEDENTSTECLRRMHSETSICKGGVRRHGHSQGKQAAAPVVQQQLDDGRCSCKANTFIVLHSDGKDGRSEPSLLDDKGFSRSLHLSMIYCIMLVLFGITFPVTEALRGVWMMSHVIGVFMAYLFSVAILFMAYLEIYEVILKKRRKAAEQQTNMASRVSHAFNLDLMESDGSANAESNSENRQQDNTDSEAVFNNACFDDNLEDLAPNVKRSNELENVDTFSRRDSALTIYTMDSGVPDDVYDYITMHHGTATIASEETNYFLKIGLLGSRFCLSAFAVANMVYISLRIEGEHQRNSCSEVTRIIYPHYVHLAFIVLQTFFLTKLCTRALRKHKAFVNFGLMHLVATNLCVWFRYLVTEVLEGLYATQEDGSDGHMSFMTLSYLAESNATNKCTTEPIMEKAGHYLFPFILEYSLIAMTTIISVYSNINIRVTGELFRSICEALQKRRVARVKGDDQPKQTGQPRAGKGSALEKSHRGLALGMVVFAGVVISIVLFFFWKNTENETKAQLCHDFSELSLLALFVVSNTAGMCHLYHFLFNPNSFNTLDHALLLISGNFFIVLELFITISKTVYIVGNDSDLVAIIELGSSLTSIVQTILQAALIIDGMQRVCIKDSHVEQKRGRGVITFLIVLNAAMWIFESFQDKYSEQMEEIEMYGDVAWAIINSLCHPLQLFFYFHSAICLAHMWHHCYQAPEYNVISTNMIH